jgi:hypothetical protein
MKCSVIEWEASWQIAQEWIGIMKHQRPPKCSDKMRGSQAGGSTISEKTWDNEAPEMECPNISS